MGTLVADRIDRPLSLFDAVEAPAPPRAPEPVREERHEQPPAVDVPSAGGAERTRDGVGGESTLDDLIAGAWEGLTAQAAAACPLCAGTLRPRYADAGAAAPVSAGCCDTCGTTLS